MDNNDITTIEDIIGYHFFEKQYLIRALTHPASANERLQQNQKCLDQEAYSTLGDAILKTGLILSFREKGFQIQGDITREKEKLEKNTNLPKVGKCLKIRKFILLGRGERGQWKNGEERLSSPITWKRSSGRFLLTVTRDFV